MCRYKNTAGLYYLKKHPLSLVSRSIAQNTNHLQLIITIIIAKPHNP